MLDAAHHVRPKKQTEGVISAALVAGWSRIILAMGRGKFNDAMGIDRKTIERAMGGISTPKAHNIFNSLTVDPTALDEIIGLYGMEIRPRTVGAGKDMAMIACIARLAAEWADVMADGVRDHQETLTLADMIHPLMPTLNAILTEAEEHRKSTVRAVR